MSIPDDTPPTIESDHVAGVQSDHVFGLSASAPGGFNATLKAALLDYLLGGVAPAAPPATVWVAICTGTFTPGTTDIAVLANGLVSQEVVAGAGSNLWNNYQRAVMPNVNGATGWAAATSVLNTQVASKTNTAIIGGGTFGAGNNSFTSTTGQAAVTGTGPTPTFWVVLNHATLSAGANVIAVGPLPGATAVTNGSAVTIPAGNVTITMI